MWNNKAVDKPLNNKAPVLERAFDFQSLYAWPGRLVINYAKRLIDQAGFAGRVAILTWQGRRGRFRLMVKLTLQEVYKIVYGSLSMILIVGFMLGFLWSTLWYGTLHNIGGMENLATFLISIHALQIAPIMTTVIIIIRYGAPATLELAIMKSSRQFETLSGMGIPAEHYLAAPRIIGCFLAIPPLLAIFILISCLGSYYMGWRINGEAILDFAFSLINVAKSKHFIVMSFKSLAIGLCLPFFCVYNGFAIKTDGLHLGADVMRRAMGEAFFFSILTCVLVSVFYG